MGETAPNPQQLLASVANRLRLIQADFADEPESTRKDYIADEIKRAMASLVPAERAAFLDALSKEFPTWDNRVEISPSAPAPATSATDLKELKDPGFLIQRLLDIAPQLSVLQRDAIIAKLRDAGLTTAGTAQWPADALSQTRPKLQMAETDNPDATNILELLAILVEFANSLDQLIWTTWKTISPKSQVRRPMNLVKSIGRFASAQKDTPRGPGHPGPRTHPPSRRRYHFRHLAGLPRICPQLRRQTRPGRDRKPRHPRRRRVLLRQRNQILEEIPGTGARQRRRGL